VEKFVFETDTVEKQASVGVLFLALHCRCYNVRHVDRSLWELLHMN